MHDFYSIKNTVLESESNGTGTELAAVLDTIDRQSFVDPAALRRFFWDMFVADAFLDNFDRHNDNWGFLLGVPAVPRPEVSWSVIHPTAIDTNDMARVAAKAVDISYFKWRNRSVSAISNGGNRLIW